ncbi:uncharacterized protein CC84DRAFT_1257193 [Paraphaeosphaeria sporulosa]|uniref:Uncharacterized protein n=1 Tax=Paraphaeosphaeria sporulosa TaxID=1460663 RepID=A0A177CMX6_9PLEO|nr:uncharacterized protein CC84DRAFT_1257193 [Paraphaeosphaeria sporulosa]OAG08312.1 hypothetical protein CC84DRAFT_1257193 [Paraphaeosphaeria sporulosa]
MTEPARKRRKTASPGGDRLTSPLKQPPRRPSISSRSFFNAEDRQTSPLKAPPRRFSISPTKGTPARSSSPLKEPPRRPPRRPSFASPTKASLSRGYPDLLQRPSSSDATALNGRADILARGKQARAFILGEQGDMAPITAEEDANGAVAGAQSPHVRNPVSQTTSRAQKTRSRKERLAGETLEEEAALPATPSHRGAEEGYTPRPGLFSSPNKLPPRLKDPSRMSRTPRKTPAVHQDGIDVPMDGQVRNVEGLAQQTRQDKPQPPDPELEEKKREKARLEKELRLLEELVSKCAEEIGRSQAQPASYVGPPEEREALVKFINELVKSGAEEDEGQPPALSSMLCSFLPFATQRIAPPNPQPDNPVASHQPLELEDPLSYLQMFTSFEFTTKLNVSRGQNPLISSRVHQRHLIDITGPQSLLTASISITIDTLSNAIVDLNLLQLPHWAERELGAFMRVRAKEKDLGNACWAVGSYWEVIKKRAEFWHRCEIAFRHLIPGRTSDDTENIDVRSRGKQSRILSRQDLSRNLGRDTLVLEDRHVSLKINWRIRFDWTGEAESEVGVVSAVPRVWREVDSNDSFKKIPEIFDSILQSKGVFAATKTMAALLFSE